MKLSKILNLSVNMLLHSKLRSWLTILGIFIGVAAVVAIISVGQGLQQNVSSQIQGLGQDIITISSGSSRALGGDFGGSRGSSVNIKQLSDRDVQTLKLVSGIKSISGIVSGRSDVKYQSETSSFSIQGYNPDVFTAFVTTSLESGRYLSPGDARAVVIGNKVAHGTYQNDIRIGYLLTLNGKEFRVIGILSASTGLGGSDNAVYMPTKDSRDVLSNTTTLKSNEYSTISVKVDDPNYITDTTDAITNALRNAHHVAVGKEDFSVISSLALQQRFSAITSGITIFLGVIAAISLVVGGIGVANTMFTSVLEKTRDIGVMKSIGAKNSDILLIFLINSGMLGMVGGILGIIGGVSASYFLPLLGGIGPGGGLKTAISPWLLIFALVFSVAIGMISGAIPAYNASKLKPVEALRYE